MTAKASLSVQLIRGQAIESQHDVDALVMTEDGKILKSWGDLSRPFYPRSMIKMLQAVDLFDSGAAKNLGLTSEQLALACASHHGEKIHTEKVLAWLDQLHLSNEALICGAHDPADKRSQVLMWKNGQTPQKYHNNCSGKHCGILSALLQRGFSPQKYGDYSHPIQIQQRKILSEASHFNFENAPWGIDGCGIPTYSADLRVWAHAMLSLLSKQNSAGQALIAAVQKNPMLVSGTEGLCSRLLIETQGAVVPKAGAEGVYMALIPGQQNVVVVKVRDGAMRAAKNALLWILETELGAVTSEQISRVHEYSEKYVKNWAGETVGEFQVKPSP
jgi:L-asparaginase II